jgi:DNA polymerase-3 subunit epsilon
MVSTELETARADALTDNKCFSKARLRDEFRMKPKPDAVPVAYYKNEFGGKFGVYRIADCLPIREVSKREQSARQARARAILALKAKLRSRAARAGKVACSWIDNNPLFLDTETTGLGYDAQIIELAIVDANGTVLLDTKLRPTVPVEPGAMEIHGIEDKMLFDAPTWRDAAYQVKDLLYGRTVVIFNDGFDSRMIQQTAAAFGESSDWWNEVDTRCAMNLAASAFGPSNRYGSISLADATIL